MQTQTQAQTQRQINVIGHPLVQHKLTLMRRRETGTASFRALLSEISMLLAYEVTRDMSVVTEEIETPLMRMSAPVLEGKKIVLISILRAGNGLLDGMLRILPSARVGHVGLYRNHETLEAIEYYFKVPSEMEDRDAIVLDPMLATGNSAVAAVERIKQVQPRSVKFVCLLAAPEGVATFHERHPDVPIYTAALDQRLNDKGYILPGLGDAGDRLFGTK
jgi:uracil phosphoribosyltransferase